MQTQLRACFVCSVDSQFYTSLRNQCRRAVCVGKLDMKTDGVRLGLYVEQPAAVCSGDRKVLSAEC